MPTFVNKNYQAPQAAAKKSPAEIQAAVTAVAAKYPDAKEIGFDLVRLQLGCDAACCPDADISTACGVLTVTVKP